MDDEGRCVLFYAEYGDSAGNIKELESGILFPRALEDWKIIYYS